jgi:hypothetical protein
MLDDQWIGRIKDGPILGWAERRKNPEGKRSGVRLRNTGLVGWKSVSAVGWM